MKRLLVPILLSLSLLAGCPASAPLKAGLTAEQAAAASFNNRAATALTTATAAMDATTALLRAKKITVEENNRVRTSLDLVVASIKTAQGTYANNADQATALLVAALNQLTAIKAGETK